MSGTERSTGERKFLAFQFLDMGKDLNPHPFCRKLLHWTFYVILSAAILRGYFYHLPLHFVFHSATDQLLRTKSMITTPSYPPLSSSLPPSVPQEEEIADETLCDYTDGKWVHDEMGPLNNGTTCGTIKERQNCIAHGRPDLGYLYWRWKPRRCKLPRFDPNTFLELRSNNHLAFVGDSMARNQLESLLCMLSTVSVPKLVYRDGEDKKFRRWYFDSHNVTISVYWSPFLVKGIEKSQTGTNNNELYLDYVDERWAADLNHIDAIVLSVGHWFLHPAVYFEGDSVLGCHYCPGLNHTKIGFYDALRKVVKTTLKTITERRGSNGNSISVILTTFSPSHFEGEMRNIEVEEVESAKENWLVCLTLMPFLN